MPSWFDDHLECAPLGLWLPELLAQGAVVVDGGVAPPRGLARLLDVGGDGGPVLVHTGPLHATPASIDAPLHDATIVVDLAWVAATAGWMRLRPWRRAPMRDDAAARIAWVSGLGLREPQQWVCTDPVAVVVTAARVRR